MHDIIVIGSGPAGLTAALYARRANKSVLILEKDSFGGQITHSPKIENFPGFATVSGTELADAMVEQVLAQGAEVELVAAEGIAKTDAGFTVHTDGGDFDAKAVILATGVKHRTLGLPREDELEGSGVSYCAVCDGAFYADKRVAVIGGGNSALQEAVLLSETASHVTVIQNLDHLTGEAKLAEILKARDNVSFIYGTVVEELLGDDGLSGLKLKNSEGEISELSVDGMFVCIGLVPNNAAFADLAACNDWGYFDSDEACTTVTPGVYVAGDCRAKSIRQITTATADGAVAALAACRFIDYGN